MGSKRISKRVREEAARVCSMCACRGEPISVTKAVSVLYGISDIEAVRMPVARIALRAWGTANRRLGIAAGHLRYINADTLRDDYAEAESLLRCGWSPGDEP